MQRGVCQKLRRFNRPAAGERTIQLLLYENQRVRMATTRQSNQRLASNFIVIFGHPSQERDVDGLFKKGSLVPTDLAHYVRGQASPCRLAVGREFSGELEFQRRAPV